MRKSIHIGLDDKTQEIVNKIPTRLRSGIFRGLLAAYDRFQEKADKPAIIPYVVMDGAVKLVIDMEGEKNAD